MSDTLSPICKGDTGAPFIPQFTQGSGYFDLTGCSISMKLQNEADAEDIKICLDSAWTILDAANGIASYAYQDSDVSTVGNYKMYITITKSGKPVHAEIKILPIIEAP